MQKENTASNVCLAAPGLAINSTTTQVKYANTFTFKANGRISPSVTTLAAPSLALATTPTPYPNGTAAVAGTLAAGFYRVYTLVGDITANGTGTVTPTYSWLASADISNTTDLPSLGYAVLPDKSSQCPIGFVIVSNVNTSTAFTPNTTALNASSITTTYIDNYAISAAH